MGWLVFWAALGPLSQAACPVPVATEVVPTDGTTDASTPLAGAPLVAGFDVPFDDFGERNICGTVAAITPEPKREGRYVVTVTDSETGGTLAMWHGVGDRPPLQVGDVVGAHLVVERIQTHQIRHLTVLDGGGRLLYALSEDGDSSYAPGWGIGPGEAIDPPNPPPTDRAYATGHAVWFTAEGVSARSSGDWRELRTPGGTYFVRGGATRWHVPPGTQPPPDTGNYSAYAIVRAPDVR